MDVIQIVQIWKKLDVWHLWTHYSSDLPNILKTYNLIDKMYTCVKSVFFYVSFYVLRLLVYNTQLLSRECVPPEFQFALLYTSRSNSRQDTSKTLKRTPLLQNKNKYNLIWFYKYLEGSLMKIFTEILLYEMLYSLFSTLRAISITGYWHYTVIWKTKQAGPLTY